MRGLARFGPGARALERAGDALARLDERRVLGFLGQEAVQVAVLALQPRHEFEEGVGQLGIELPAAQPLDFRQRIGNRPGFLVRPLVGERVEHVGQRRHARRDRDRGAGQPVWITAAIPALMVMPRNLLRDVHLRNVGLAEDLPAGHGVRFHDLALAGRQLAGLQQDRIGHHQLADVVQARGQIHQEAHVVFQPDLASQDRRQPADPVAVLAGRVVEPLGGERLLFDQLTEVLDPFPIGGGELAAQLALVPAQLVLYNVSLTRRCRGETRQVLAVVHEHLFRLGFLVQRKQLMQVHQSNVWLAGAFVRGYCCGQCIDEIGLQLAPRNFGHPLDAR